MIIRFVKFFALCAALWMLAGCYSFTATTLPAHIRTVVIHEVDNRTLDPVLGNRLRDGIVTLFKRNAGKVRIVNEDGDADFKVTLLSYSNRPDNFSADAEVESYKVVMKVNVTFFDNVKNTMIYDGKNLSAEGTYDVLKNESEENHGQERAIEKLKALIVSNALAKW